MYRKHTTDNSFDILALYKSDYYYYYYEIEKIDALVLTTHKNDESIHIET